MLLLPFGRPSHHTLCWNLATTGAVEDTPHKEVIAEVFKSMFGCGGHEKKVPRLKPVPLAIVKQNASPANHDVDLVLFVRRLLVRACRCTEFHVEGAALQNDDGALAGRVRDPGLSLSKTDHTATSRLAHA